MIYYRRQIKDFITPVENEKFDKVQQKSYEAEVLDAKIDHVDKLIETLTKEKYALEAERSKLDNDEASMLGAENDLDIEDAELY